MKYLYLLFIIITSLTLTSCDTTNTKEVDNEQYLILVDLLNNPVFNDEELSFNVIYNENYVELIKSYKYFLEYLIKFTKNDSKYKSTVNSSTITKIDELTYEETIFSDNIEITSLDLFSTIILDSYEDEFLYYNSKSFIPLALELLTKDDITFTYESDQFSMNTYMIQTNIENLSLSDDLHNALMKSSTDYQNLYNLDNPLIRLSFKTDKNSKYLLSSIEFHINNVLIAQII